MASARVRPLTVTPGTPGHIGEALQSRAGLAREDAEAVRAALFTRIDLGIQAAKAANMLCIDVRPWYLPRKRERN